MSVAQGDVWWVDMAPPAGSKPGFRRPVVVVQGNEINRSRVATVVCVPMTSNMRWADAPGNVVVESRRSGLSRDSVANASQVISLDRGVLVERVGHLPDVTLELILDGIEVVLGR